MYEYNAYVTRVVDGDTFDAIVDLGFHVSVNLRFRLADVDTPEIFHPSCPAERIHGYEAKAFVENRILNKNIVVQTKKTGKYGRWIAHVIELIDDENPPSLSEQLIEAGLEKRDSYIS